MAALILMLAVLAVTIWARDPARLAVGRPGLAVALVVVLAALPFALPARALAGRVVLAGFALALGTKLWTALAGVGPRDAASNRSAGRYLLWLLVPPELRWPRDVGEAAANRRSGLRRLGRAAAKLVVLGAIACAKPHLGPGALLSWALLPLELYAFLTGLADVVTGAVMLAGIEVDETFRRPFLAPTPAEFWGRRWNLYVGTFLRRHVFAPFARRGHAGVGVAASFVVSGLLHEYLVVAILGPSRYRPGYMFAFFALQAVALLSVRAMAPLGSPPRNVAIALHGAWLVGTSPLFFVPLVEAAAAFDVALRTVSSALLAGFW